MPLSLTPAEKEDIARRAGEFLTQGYH